MEVEVQNAEALEILPWEIFTLAKEQPYNDMSDKQVIEDALKCKNRQTLARPYYLLKCIRLCWNAGPTTQSSEQHLRNFFNCLPPFTLMNDV